MIFLLILVVKVAALKEICDMEVQETSTSYYHSKIVSLNVTNRQNVRQIELLQHKDIFTIDSSSLVLQAIRSIDREKLCDQADQGCDCFKPVCLLKITILVVYIPSTNTAPDRIYKNICISDTNDNRPTFPESIQSLDLNENVDAGKDFNLHSAVDQDSANFTIVSYNLKCPQTIFNLTYFIPDDGLRRTDHNVKVILLKKMVYHADVIVCNLSACDPEFCSDIKLLVKINDVNDHRPLFNKTLYLRTVKEDVPHDTVIDRFEAVDLDPIYGKVSYSIGRVMLPSDPKALSDGLFTIDSSSGELRINKNVDYEDPTYRKFEVILVAKDNGTPTLSSSTTVQITVENVNDNSPTIKLNKAHIDVKENSSPHFLDYFTVTDDDEIDSEKISCRVSEPEYLFELKKSNSNSPIIFEIYSVAIFDFEKQTMITMVIRCEDGGSPLLTALRRVTINILDVNDNVVYFPLKVIQAHIAENAPIGTEVARIVAIDLDRKSSLIYSLVDPRNCSYMNIDSYHGYLTSNEIFDRETQDLYVFKVKVEERDKSNFSDVAEVHLRIMDTNDNSPTFKESYTFSLAENVTINTVIGRVHATDPDLGHNGTITYFHGTQSSKGPEYFRVGNKGEILLFQQLDFEIQPLHNLVIVARDHGHAAVLSSSTSVVIKVIDSNDHPPRFDERTSSLNLPCQSQDIGKDLISVSDRDQSPENTMVNYGIEKVEPLKYTSLFSINKSTGFISMITTKEQCTFKFVSREKVDITLHIYDPTKTEFKDRANLIIFLENDKYERKVESNRIMKTDSSNNWFNKNKHKPPQTDSDGFGQPDDFVDQNIIIVMILIFITVFLGIILISLVCFIKRRRQAGEEQDVSERMGMMREKIHSPVQSDKMDYSKNSDSYTLTMKNMGANDCYYPTLTDNFRLKTKENITTNKVRNNENMVENNLFSHEISKIKDNSAYQSLTIHPRPEENYSVIESFLLNSQSGNIAKSQPEIVSKKAPNPITTGARPYVSVSFV